jgi:hypothetical protein
MPTLLLFHDSWAGALIALSVALRSPQRYGASIAVGLLAVMFREIAMPYLLLMCVVAAYEKRWRETCGWSLAMAVAGIAFYLHAQAVLAVTVPGDLGSLGWFGWGGWGFLAASVSKTTLLVAFPDWLARLALPLSLFGWLAWKSDCALRVSGLLLGYAVMLMVIARPDNFYWSVMIAPLLLGGICFVPAGLAALVQGAQSSIRLRPEHQRTAAFVRTA